MSQFFAMIGNLLMIGVIVTYFKQVKDGVSVPNPTTWLLWMIVGVMNAVSYVIVVRGDPWQSMVVIVSAIGLTFIFLYSMVKEKFGGFGKMEMICFVFAVIILILWKTTGDADLANISLQVVFIISFIPTIHGLLTHRLKEKAFSWNLAVIAYGFIIAGIITAESYRGIALVFPIVNGIIGNGSIALIVFFQKKEEIAFAEIKDAPK